MHSPFSLSASSGPSAAKSQELDWQLDTDGDDDSTGDLSSLEPDGETVTAEGIERCKRARVAFALADLRAKRLRARCREPKCDDDLD